MKRHQPHMAKAHHKKQQKRREAEDKLQRDLNTPLGEDNKGFKLLAAQGYKVGQGLGAAGQGRQEPLAVQIRDKRAGLGVEEARRQRAYEAEQQRQLEQAQQAQREARAVEAYTGTARHGFRARQVQGQVRAAWRALESLELRARGLSEDCDSATLVEHSSSLKSFLTLHPALAQLLLALDVLAAHPAPPDVRPAPPLAPAEPHADHSSGATAAEDTCALNAASAATSPVAGTAHPQRSGPSPPEPQQAGPSRPLQAVEAQTRDMGTARSGQVHGGSDPPELVAQAADGVAQEPVVVDLNDAGWLEEQLRVLHAYLRGTHWYCLYCGCQYDGQDDLSSNCPGPAEDDH